MFRLPTRGTPLAGCGRSAAFACGLRSGAGRNLRLGCRLSVFAAVAMPIATVSGAEAAVAEAPPPVGQQSLGDAMEQLRVQEEVSNMDPNSPEPDDDGGGRKRQYLVVMRHGQRADEINPDWVKTAARPFDPPLTEYGEEQARSVAEKLKQYDIQHVYISPFYRCIQTARLTSEGLKIPPERWTVSVAVCEFLNPMILVKKGGKLPEGHIQSWFWERGSLKDSLTLKLPANLASKVKVGQTEFKRYPENLLNSRVRYGRAFQDIADEAKGNVLVVTHGDAVNSSVSRLRPWAIVHPVHHTGFTAAYRDEKEDGSWGPWHLESKSGENGVWWYEQLGPAFSLYHGARGVVSAACRLVPFRQHARHEPAPEPVSPGAKK